MIMSYLLYIDEWVHWNTRVENYIYPIKTIPDYSTILVPNVDNTRMQYLIKLIAKQDKVRKLSIYL